MSVSTIQLEPLAINTIRTLSMDAVQRATCGHPGTPMALAPMSYVLWNRILRWDPNEPQWPARDRVVLSCGHASMLLYSMIHLSGTRAVDVTGMATDQEAISLEDIKNFRQMGSPCAGHPEYGEAAGIETTTGPLGQGIGNSVGMAIAAQWCASRYDRPGFDLFGYNVYALCSDGDVMEGLGCEAASLAGHLKLDNLCWIYDDNHITIEGDTELAFSEDVGRRFEGLGWHVIHVEDANDLTAMQQALESFQATTGKPTLIILRSVIGYGSPNKANTAAAHGSALGEEEVRLTKRAYGWPEDAEFLVPEGVTELFDQQLGARGRALHQTWRDDYQRYQKEHPALAAEWETMRQGHVPEGWDAEIPTFSRDDKMATRASSGKVLHAVADQVPWLLGGSADLAPSNNTLIQAEHFSATQRSGRNFHWGVREHAMAAAANGMALSGLRPYVATFFVFSDYLRPSLRLSALMQLPVLYIFTHDSIGLGEDGPTHQPVEQLAACRSIPGLIVIRPCDANEVAQAYRTILPRNDRPVALVLTRQGVPTLDRDEFPSASELEKGAYVLADSTDGKPDVILIGTGSEVHVCVDAYRKLVESGVKVRLVSMPSWELFDQQDQAYRESVLPPVVTARVAVEAGVRQGWDKYLGTDGRFVGMQSFGASAPAAELYAHFGITPDAVIAEAKAAIAKRG